mmetsp:Transcript_21674/g.86114  ORF Transcript_21674/g.86114 Transcript_21674/m.86114 type:complete len:369 (+) Transcript_21674:658-1764(+)
MAFRGSAYVHRPLVRDSRCGGEHLFARRDVWSEARELLLRNSISSSAPIALIVLLLLIVVLVVIVLIVVVEVLVFVEIEIFRTVVPRGRVVGPRRAEGLEEGRDVVAELGDAEARLRGDDVDEGQPRRSALLHLGHDLEDVVQRRGELGRRGEVGLGDDDVVRDAERVKGLQGDLVGLEFEAPARVDEEHDVAQHRPVARREELRRGLAKGLAVLLAAPSEAIPRQIDEVRRPLRAGVDLEVVHRRRAPGPLRPSAQRRLPDQRAEQRALADVRPPRERDLGPAASGELVAEVGGFDVARLAAGEEGRFGQVPEPRVGVPLVKLVHQRLARVGRRHPDAPVWRRGHGRRGEPAEQPRREPQPRGQVVR